MFIIFLFTKASISRSFLVYGMPLMHNIVHVWYNIIFLDDILLAVDPHKQQYLPQYGQTAWAVSHVTHNIVLRGMGVVLKCYVKE